jgi:hypothetical protein
VVLWSAAASGSCRVPCMAGPVVGAGGWSWSLELSPHSAKWVRDCRCIRSTPTFSLHHNLIMVDAGVGWKDHRFHSCYLDVHANVSNDLSNRMCCSTALTSSHLPCRCCVNVHAPSPSVHHPPLRPSWRRHALISPSSSAPKPHEALLAPSSPPSPPHHPLSSSSPPTPPKPHSPASPAHFPPHIFHLTSPSHPSVILLCFTSHHLTRLQEPSHARPYLPAPHRPRTIRRGLRTRAPFLSNL